jgi:hypothetical protein
MNWWFDNGLMAPLKACVKDLKPWQLTGGTIELHRSYYSSGTALTAALNKGTFLSILPAMVSLIGKLESSVIVELAL